MATRGTRDEHKKVGNTSDSQDALCRSLGLHQWEEMPLVQQSLGVGDRISEGIMNDIKDMTDANGVEKVAMLYQPRGYKALSLMALMSGLFPGALPNIKMCKPKAEHVRHQGEKERMRRQRQKDKAAFKKGPAMTEIKDMTDSELVEAVGDCVAAKKVGSLFYPVELAEQMNVENPKSITRTHKECAGCLHEKEEPMVCNDHAPGEIHCLMFRPKGEGKVNVEELTRDEKSLLLYLECRAVDDSGTLDSRQMNQADFEIAKRWNESGFIKFGRIGSIDLRLGRTHWCVLSEDAWIAAHKIRRLKSERTIAKLCIERIGL